jgi:hypothetical protein
MSNGQWSTPAYRFCDEQASMIAKAQKTQKAQLLESAKKGDCASHYEYVLTTAFA